MKVENMSESINPFTEIFKRLTKEEFMEDPTRILSLMMDFGFDSRQIRMIRTVMAEDMKEIREFLECPVDSENDIAEKISDYCFVSKNALISILEGIKSSLCKNVETEIIEDKEYGKCRRSTDGIATYSLDMTKLYQVTNVDTFNIPNSVTEIGEYAFYGCTSLERIHIPDSVTEIGDSTFQRCISLNEVVIPDSVTEIGDDAFEECTSLEKVHIPDSVTEISYSAFQRCIHAFFKVSKDNRHYSSHSGALFDKDGRILLAGYSLVRDGRCMIPECVKIIGDGAFFGCESLSEVVIPDSVTGI